MKSRRAVCTAVVAAGVLGLALSARAQQTPSTRPAPSAQANSPSPTRPVVGPKEDLKNLTLVKSDTGSAIVRFGTGGLQVLVVGDRVGRTAAVVKSIEPGRLVIDETAPGADGTPQQTQIVLRDGETGGARYSRRPDQPAPAGLRPQIVEPRGATPDSAKKSEVSP